MSTLFNRQTSTFLAVCVLFGGLLSSCTRILTSTVIEPAVGNLQYQTDIELVCDGSPSYLLMIDSMVTGSPSNAGLLQVASQSYSGYAAALGECGGSEERILVVSAKARDYGLRLLSKYLGPVSEFGSDALDKRLAALGKSDVEPVFWSTFGWLSWVTTAKGSPAAMADITSIEKIMTRLLELDEGFENGMIHLFLGTYYATKPEMFGGQPELARQHFERALELSGGKLLMIQTTYAETLARNTFDKELHDRLLQEVIDFDLNSAPQYGLSNSIAKRRASRLLAENYFAE